jgi:hypothetical protein
MFATPDNGNAFTASQGASFLVAGLIEVAAEIESLRTQGKPQEIPPIPVEEDESPRGSIIGGAFAMGAILPLVAHATSLGLGVVTKLLFLSASLAPVIFAR